jgi:hypothetical protein
MKIRFISYVTPEGETLALTESEFDALRAFGSEPPSVATILEATNAGGDFAAPMLPALCTGFRLPHGCAVKFIAGGQRHPLADQCRARACHPEPEKLSQRYFELNRKIAAGCATDEEKIERWAIKTKRNSTYGKFNR